MANEHNGENENGLLHEINNRLKTIARGMEQTQIADYVQLLNSPRRLIALNLIAGISRGVGIAVGISIFTALIVQLLNAIGALNLPIIGDFIAEIVKIVEHKLDGGY